MMHQTEEIFTVGGMSCSGCELRIEQKLNGMPGVRKVSASFSTGKVRVVYDAARLDRGTIVRAIRELGYTVEDPAHGEYPVRKKEGISGLLGILLVLAAFYFLIQRTVGFGFLSRIPQISPNMGYGLLFVAGLFTSIHCLAMCGGINLSQCVSDRPEKAGPGAAQRLVPSLLYNSGRVLSYTVIGGIIGAAGSVVSFSATAKAVVTVLSGLFMLLMGLNMLHAFPWLRRLSPHMPKFVGRKLYAGGTKRGPFYIGLLNGLMPCGPLQAMQLYALGTGSFLAGSFSMLMFGLGTLPLMFAFGAVSSFLSAKFTHRMMRVSAALVMVLGLFMVGRGFTLSGASIGASAASAKNSAVVSGNIQQITTSFDNGYYVPITVKQGVPVRWTIRVTDADLNGCNNPVTIPAYGIQKKLVPGDNVVEFLPKESGTISYTCWMGMIHSTITVVGSGGEPPAASSPTGTAEAAAGSPEPNCCVSQP
ncbi:MAG: sulfite exporter TauE/SafE family protein [Oscillospiraceae bacterium]|nr:sulfite exporter TauE/SafE family protein [Oscillospiraceae bacterium]MCI1990757.1 sulfite exporter TauE/SafE family protein [Oscillospiraceae bacterium]MCI2035725.1 sulfite exporter TauE/SafE family protein [Oscillospiraceae bacterium]